jgi:hypothetical protein
LTTAPQISFSSAMPTRNELLADHFLKAAGIAAVYADGTGAIGAVDVVGIDAPSGWTLLCCAAGRQIRIAAKGAAQVAGETDQAAALAVLRSVAADCGVGLTPHQAVIQRAFAAVETVNQRMAALQKTGGMRDMNHEFKAARKAGMIVRYQDFLHAKKLAMLEAITRRR